MKKEMLINVMQPEECRIAIIEDGVLQELYVERTSQESYVNNIYKGKIVNIEPSIQAAFVAFGIGRNGFLHVSDVASAYFKGQGGERGDRRDDRGGRGDRRGDREDRGGRGGRDRDRDRRPFEPVEIPSGPPPAAFRQEPPAAEPELEEEFGDFGAGLDVEMTSSAGTIISAPGSDLADVEEDIAAEMAPEDGDASEPVEESGEVAEGEAKPKRRRSSGSKNKGKKAAGDESEAKPKRKRVSKKKGEGQEEQSGGEDDDKPKYMGSAEHRTAGDEPEFY